MPITFTRVEFVICARTDHNLGFVNSDTDEGLWIAEKEVFDNIEDWEEELQGLTEIIEGVVPRLMSQTSMSFEMEEAVKAFGWDFAELQRIPPSPVPGQRSTSCFSSGTFEISLCKNNMVKFQVIFGSSANIFNKLIPLDECVDALIAFKSLLLAHFK